MTHKTFCVKSLDKIQEKEIVEQFILYLKSFNCDKNITWRLYHYSSVEKHTLNKLLTTYNIVPETYGVSIEWIDLCDILIKYKFVFKNCFDYSIKSINKVLNQIGYIPDNFIYKNTLIKNGLDTIIAVYKSDNLSKFNDIVFSKIDIMEDIIFYNMIDCISLYYLRNFMQENVIF
jgi:predicted RecB family nuclease